MLPENLKHLAKKLKQLGAVTHGSHPWIQQGRRRRIQHWKEWFEDHQRTPFERDRDRTEEPIMLKSPHWSQVSMADIAGYFGSREPPTD